MPRFVLILGACLVGTLAFASELLIPLTQGEMAHLPPREGVQGQDLALEVVYTGNQSDVSAAKILYRLSGQIGFLESTMNFKGLTLYGTIPGDNVAAPGLEYVIVLQLRDGGILAYPAVENPMEQPVYIPVIEPRAQVENRQGGSQSGQIIILTPEPGVTLPYGEDLVVAVSLFNLENVDVNSIKVFFDNVNVTAYSVLSEDLVTYRPDFLKPGNHKVSIEVSNLYRVRIATSNWNFTIESKAQSLFQVDLHSNLTMSNRSNLIHIPKYDDTTKVLLGYNAENVAVSRLDFNIDANMDWVRLTSTVNLTSQERPDVQPQNRFNINAKNSWLRYTYGDASPMMNRLGLWGKRVRGHSLKLMSNWATLQIVSGETDRAVIGSAAFDTTAMSWNRNNYHFQKHLFGIRPAFGNGRNFQLGFFYVHARDSVNSVELRPDLNLSYPFTIAGSSDPFNIQFGDDQLIAFGDTTNLNYKFNNAFPEDNLVVGTDLTLGLDERRMLLEFEGALSLTNRNIFDGALTRAELDTFGLLSDSTYDDTLGSGTLDIPFSTIDDALSSWGLGFLLTDGQFDPGKLEQYFVLNRNILIPVDVNKYTENPLKGLTSIAYSMRLRLNYFKQFISISYNYVAPNFRAAGSPFITTDNAGWKISDKVRLLDNMLYLNLGYEFKKDNVLSLNENLEPRTASKSYIGGFTFNPGRGLPTFSANLKSYQRDNNIDTLSVVDSTTYDPRILDNTLSTSINLSYNLNLGTIQNNINLNYMNSGRNDLRVGSKGILQTADLVGLNLRSEWTIPLITTLTVRRNTNQIFEPANPLYRTNTYFTLGGSAAYNLFNSALNIRTGLTQIMSDQGVNSDSGMVNTSESQTKFELSTRYRFKPLTIAQYSAKSQIAFLMDVRLYNVANFNYSDKTYFIRYEMGF